MLMVQKDFQAIYLDNIPIGLSEVMSGKCKILLKNVRAMRLHDRFVLERRLPARLSHSTATSSTTPLL